MSRKTSTPLLSGDWEAVAQLPPSKRPRDVTGRLVVVRKSYYHSGPDHPQYRHGMIRTPEYRAWCHMWDRCTNPKDKRYHVYGARGITVDPIWRDFTVFYRDMGPRPVGRYSLERIDNNGNYCKANCRWATYAEQAKNKNKLHPITVDGIKFPTLRDAAKFYGHPNSRIYARINDYGWPVEKALKTGAVQMPQT